jgi:hypothetical protein
MIPLPKCRMTRQNSRRAAFNRFSLARAGDGNVDLVQHDRLIIRVYRVSLKSGRPTPFTRSREKSHECGLAAIGFRLKGEL